MGAIDGPGVAVGGVPLGGAEAHAVGGVLVNVEVERDAVFAEGLGELETIVNGYTFVVEAVPDETGRGLGGDLEFVGEIADEVFGGIGAEEVVLAAFVSELAHGNNGVAEDAQAGPRTFPLDWVGGVGLA